MLWQNARMKIFSWIRPFFFSPVGVQIKLQLRFPLLLLGILLLAAFLLPDRVWNTLLIGFGGIFLLAYGWVSLLAHHLSGGRWVQLGWVSVGDHLEEQFYLQNDSFVPVLWVEVLDESTLPDYASSVVRSLGGYGQDRWRRKTLCTQRGAYRLGPWSFCTGDPFGIFSMTRHFDYVEEIVIYPPIDASIGVALPTGERDGRIRSAQHSWKATINSATVREYQTNDPLRWIHWPTTARRGGLYVRQFDLDATGDIWLCLDLQAEVQLGVGMESTEEHAVLLAATLAVQGLRAVRAVGLATYGDPPHLLPVGRGRGQQWRILRVLALLTANGQADIGVALDDLGKVVRRGSAMVIITPSGSLDWLPALLSLGQRGIACTVVLLDRESFGGRGNTAVLQQAIQRLGFTCYIVRQGELGNPLLAKENEDHDYRITPLGRVVVK